MLAFEEARKIAENKLNQIPKGGDIGELVILDDAIVEKPYAWIFGYNSKLFIETGDMLNALGGNSPLFISKINGLISTYRSGLSLEKMIAEYEEEHKLYNLTLTNNIYSNSQNLLDLKKVLGLSTKEITEFKKLNQLIIATGSMTKLNAIQTDLNANKIKTIVTLRNLE